MNVYPQFESIHWLTDGPPERSQVFIIWSNRSKLAESLVWPFIHYSNQSDTSSRAFKHRAGQSGSSSPSWLRPVRNQMLSPQEKGSSSWSYHIISWTNTWHPEYDASQHYTLKQEHTGYVFFFSSSSSSNCQPLPCSTGKRLMRPTSWLNCINVVLR